MAVRNEQIEFLRFRKMLDKALRDKKLLEVDYKYDLGKEEVMEDSDRLLQHLCVMEDSLKSIREMMR